jgi:5S rRNA maturation endonuclease (ribonuclease M5)
MDSRGDKSWERDTPKYAPEQVEACLRECGVEIAGETVHDFLCYCPYHGNRHTPSFGVSRSSGKFICYNHSCSEMGTLVELIKHVSSRNEFEARRLIIKMSRASERTFLETLQATLNPEPEFEEFAQDKIDVMVKNFWDNPEAVRYMTEERRFTEETLRKFQIGYSAKKGIIAVPMHNKDGLPVGVIGRPASAERKAFKNSRKLPTSKTLWNLHRAKRFGGTVGVVEASFDGMRVDQAGFPNVVACLGGHLSDYHIDQLDKYFDTIVILTDFDNKQFFEGCRKCLRKNLNLCAGHNPGRDLGQTLATKLARKNVLWGAYDEKVVYPDGNKDIGDSINDDIIRQIWHNAVPNYIYQKWNLY